MKKETKKKKSPKKQEDVIELIECIDEESGLWEASNGKYYYEDGTLYEDEVIQLIECVDEESGLWKSNNGRLYYEDGTSYIDSLESYVSYNEEIKCIVIDIEKIFGRDDINYVKNFPLIKRNYYTIAPLIVNDYNLVINNCEDFIFFILDVKSEIVALKDKYLQENRGLPYTKSKKNMTDAEKLLKIRFDEEDKERLIRKVRKILKLDNVFGFISWYVENTYTLNLDSRINVNEKNLEYAISDKINKVVLKTSMVARLLIPLISEIMMDDDKLYLLLSSIMNKFDGKTKKTKNKLYKFIELRVNRTLYSDAVMWDFLSNRSIDSNLYIAELNRKLTNEIIPKFGYNKSIVSYLDVVVRKKIIFLFTYDYPINYKCIKSSDKDSDDKEKLEIYITKKDYFEKVIHQLSIKEITNQIEEIPEEFEYLLNVKNPFAMKYMHIFYAKLYKFDCRYYETEEDRVKLLLYMYVETMEKYGMTLIPNILISDIIIEERRINNRRKIDKSILFSKKYQRFEREYKPVMHLFTVNNQLGTLTSIDSYKCFIPDESGNIDLEINYRNLFNELLSLCLL